MQKSKGHPLAMGLIGHESGAVYAQIEITLRDFDTVDFVIRREPYSNLPDVKFSIDYRDIDDVIEILNEAKKKLDAYWISRLAAEELEV